MSDWITLIISFIEKHVISFALGLLAFVTSYHYFESWQEFQRPEVFWVIVALCITIAMSVSVLVKRVVKVIFDANRRKLEIRKAQARARDEWENTVVCEFASLSESTKAEIKKRPLAGERFGSSGNDTAVERLHHMQAVTIIGVTPFGFIFVLTEFGAQAVRKRKRDLY